MVSLFISIEYLLRVVETRRENEGRPALKRVQTKRPAGDTGASFHDE
jgi:hypothetical protein